MAATAGPEPSTRAAGDVAADVRTDREAGLAPEDAAARLAHDGPNALTAAPPVPAWRRLLAQLADPLVYLLVGAVALSLLAWSVEGRDGPPYDAIVVALVIVANAVIGFAQERRSARAVEALQRMAAPHAVVVRGGDRVTVPASAVVVGDLLVLAEGDAIAADARVVAGSLWVAEAALTGESAPVEKSSAALRAPAALGDRSSMVFAGTAATRGSATAIVTATAMDTETGRVAAMLESTPDDPTPLQREIARLGRTLGLVVVVIAIVVVGSVLLTRDVDGLPGLVDVLFLGVALAVAAVPEGLPAIMSVVLALGVQRMAGRNAIVKDLASVETLGSASVICSDKTGTLTENRMAITQVVTASGGSPVDGADPLGRRAVALGALASDATERADGRLDGDPTEVAFLAAARAHASPEDQGSLTRLDSVPFSSERRRMSVLAGAGDGARTLVVKGAPDVVLDRSARQETAEGDMPLDPDRRRRVERALEELAGRGMRTLAVAVREAGDAPAASEELERELTLVGLVGIVDPPRDAARLAVAEAQRAGIRVVMITGDHPRTAVAIAGDLGIVATDAPALTGADLDGLDDQALADAVGDVSVYARVAPEHKLRIVDALQARGAVVAMTGDGVNDAPALRSADIGVAMGRGGTEVAREAANMILTDDDFATIVEAVREGRGILDTITRFLRFLLASNLGEVLAVFLGVLAASWLGLIAADGAVLAPLLATQILWINLLTDLGPALAVSAEEYADDLMDRRPRPLGTPLIGRRMWAGIAVTGLAMAVVTLATFDLLLPGGLIEGTADVDTARTAAFTVLVIANLTVVFSARSETVSVAHRLLTNPWLWGAVGLSLTLQVAVVHVPALNSAFSTAPLDARQWAACVALAMVVPAVSEVRKAVLRSRDRRARAAVG
ncbi:cation-transporting P-type ATPase [Demequina sp. SYSU T00039]|uniref:Cation-transporting P-type ATPase n=1 Tax=Demequina lignilytica TaxID=3051663 RepID=A0AAW7M5H7_9MICO|nr:MULTISPECIES: cation-transporting P-type ATPase [unclassified Demequina]MDN4477043.1 cation-transporting P-type ATPase [Demequina sp. SYSU T00039-1]MDN4487216.1 cation-transporting P-type ATPase [Demequina sp. SYSU T00039]MDN4491789.1 cation-transporting P-type ATPase [Demequina sp. SYSU T00068]